MKGTNGETLHISYETCGNVDIYSEEKVLLDLENAHLRISFPGDGSDGFTLVTAEDEDGNEYKTGRCVRRSYLCFNTI